MNKLPYFKSTLFVIGCALVGAGNDNILIGLGTGLIIAVVINMLDEAFKG